MALAATLGVGSDPAPMIAPLALNMNGSAVVAVTLSSRLAALVGPGPKATGLASLIARRREEGASPLTFAVVFPYSAHSYLLRAWMAEAGIDPDSDVRLTVVPPPRMAELLAGGVIEGFCAGEPWSAAAIAARTGPGSCPARADIWRAGPDKVLGVTAGLGRAHQPGPAGDPARAAPRGGVGRRARLVARSWPTCWPSPTVSASRRSLIGAGLRTSVGLPSRRRVPAAAGRCGLAVETDDPLGPGRLADLVAAAVALASLPAGPLPGRRHKA